MSGKLYYEIDLPSKKCQNDRGTDYHCKKCDSKLKEVHEKNECNTCANWGFCGHNCTLSGLFCKKCDKKIPL
jgi:hypothetical protein